MKTIHKYRLDIREEQALLLPADAKILSVQDQRGMWCLWALVDPDAPRTERLIVIYGTGHPVDDMRGRLVHISTFQQRDGALVWHAFERQNAEW